MRCPKANFQRLFSCAGKTRLLIIFSGFHHSICISYFDLWCATYYPKNGSNQGMVPEARAAMDRFKMEAAAEVGVNLKQGYNGDLTSRQAGSVGGQMVKKMCPVHTSSFARECRTAVGHCVSVQYIAEWI